MIVFSIHNEQRSRLKKLLESANDEYSYFNLNKEIDTVNESTFMTAVNYVVNSTNSIKTLVSGVEVEQIRKVSEQNKTISNRARNAVVTWSDLAAYIRNQKKLGNAIDDINPFSKQEYTLFNAYGANLIKSPIPRIYEREIEKLSKFNSDISSFLSNSNNALEKQLNIIFDIITDKRKEAVGTVLARKRNSKLIYMEFLKYSSLLNKLNVVDVDRLIDLILRQYIYRLEQGTISVTSHLDIHKIQIPAFMDKPQAIINTSLDDSELLSTDYFSIVPCSASTNPLFDSELCADRRMTYLGIDVDYTIDGIQDILIKNSIENSKKIWNTLVKYGKHGENKYITCKHNSGSVLVVESYCELAMYSPNGTAPIKECPSSLIQLLRKYAWVPDRNGTLYRPADITIEELHSDFMFDYSNRLISALMLGENRK